MKVQEIMERLGLNQTGRAIAYIKDGLREIEMLHEVHLKNASIDITVDKRNYPIPNDAVKIVDIKCKNHLNSNDEYRSIPRLIYEPVTKDND